METKSIHTVNLQRLMDDIREWSDNQFSDGVFTHERTLPITYHLQKEVDELIEILTEAGNNVSDPYLIAKVKEEYADCIMLLLDSACHFGLSAERLYQACYVKLEINKKRKWGKPDLKGVIEHIKEKSDEH